VTRPRARRVARARPPRGIGVGGDALSRPAARGRRPPLIFDATTEPDPGPLPEAVFDRVTGPYGAPRGQGEGP